jgi:hypothetical protein
MTPVAATHTLTNLSPGQHPMSALSSDLISTILMPMLQQQERARLGRCSQALRVADWAPVKGDRALVLNERVIGKNPVVPIRPDLRITQLKLVGVAGILLLVEAMDQVVRRYPCVHTFDLSESHMDMAALHRFSELMTTNQPVQRLARGVKIIGLKLPNLSGHKYPVGTGAAGLLWRLDWSRLEYLDCRLCYLVGPHDFPRGLSERLREATNLRRLYMSTFVEGRAQLIRELPPTVEHLDADISDPSHVEALIEKLAARTFDEICLSFSSDSTPDHQERVLNALVPHLSRVRVLALHYCLSEGDMERVVAPLSQNGRLQSATLATTAPGEASARFLERFLPLASRGSLQSIDIRTNVIGFLSAQTIFLAQAILRFPSSVKARARDAFHPVVSSREVEKLYIKRFQVFAEPDSALKRAKLFLINQISKDQIDHDYRSRLLRKGVTAESIDQCINELDPLPLIQTFEALLTVDEDIQMTEPAEAT